jgi:hypothetical protein
MRVKSGTWKFDPGKYPDRQCGEKREWLDKFRPEDF